jgi:hypothetical protein
MWGKVIKVGEAEWEDMKRQVTFAKPGECQHLHLKYVEHGEQLICKDCDHQVTAIWALLMYFTQHQREKERLECERMALEEDKAKQIIHRAALLVQDAWRRIKFTPTCPHCSKPISPPDGFGNRFKRGKDGALPMVMRPNLELVQKAETKTS